MIERIEEFCPGYQSQKEEGKSAAAGGGTARAGALHTHPRCRTGGEPGRRLPPRPDGAITWRETQLGRLVRGDQPLRPMIELKSIDLIDGRQRQAIEQRLRHWLDRLLRHRLRPIYTAQSAKLEPAARGLVYQLSEGLGALTRESVRAQLGALTSADRKALAALGVRIGAVTIWLGRLDDRRQRRLLGLLAALWHRLKLDGEGKPDPLLLDASGARGLADGRRQARHRGARPQLRRIGAPGAGLARGSGGEVARGRRGQCDASST